MLVRMFECSSAGRHLVGEFPLADIVSANGDAFSDVELASFSDTLNATGKAKLCGFVGAYADFERVDPLEVPSPLS